MGASVNLHSPVDWKCATTEITSHTLSWGECHTSLRREIGGPVTRPQESRLKARGVSKAHSGDSALFLCP